MKKMSKLTAVTAVLVAVFATSAFAETRHPNETNEQWRGDNRSHGDDRYRDDHDRDRDRGDRRGDYHDNRDFVRGYVERIDFRRGTILLRDRRSNRRITVFMVGGSRNRRGVDLTDLRRGDYVTLAGDWNRRGVFQAYRVESVREGRW